MDDILRPRALSITEMQNGWTFQVDSRITPLELLSIAALLTRAANQTLDQLQATAVQEQMLVAKVAGDLKRNQ